MIDQKEGFQNKTGLIQRSLPLEIFTYRTGSSDNRSTALREIIADVFDKGGIGIERKRILLLQFR